MSDTESHEAGGASPADPDTQRAQRGASDAVQPGLGDEALPSDADLAALGMDAEEWQLQCAMALSMEASSAAHPSGPQGLGRKDRPCGGHCSGGGAETAGPSSKPAAEGSRKASGRADGLPPPPGVSGKVSIRDAGQSSAAGAAAAKVPNVGGSVDGGSPGGGAASGKGAKRGGSGDGKTARKRRRGGLQASDEELEAAFAVVACGRSHVMLRSILQARTSSRSSAAAGGCMTWRPGPLSPVPLPDHVLWLQSVVPAAGQVGSAAASRRRVCCRHRLTGVWCCSGTRLQALWPRLSQSTQFRLRG